MKAAVTPPAIASPAAPATMRRGPAGPAISAADDVPVVDRRVSLGFARVRREGEGARGVLAEGGGQLLGHRRRDRQADGDVMGARVADRGPEQQKEREEDHDSGTDRPECRLERGAVHGASTSSKEFYG